MRFRTMTGLGLVAVVLSAAACTSGGTGADVSQETPTATETVLSANDIEFPEVFDSAQKDTIITIPSKAVACEFGEQETMPFAKETPSPGGPIGSVTCQAYFDAALAKLESGAPTGAAMSTPTEKANGLMTSAVGFGAFVIGSKIDAANARVLQPGQGVEYDGAQCVAADDGVRCRGTNSPGFVLTETDYRMLKS